GGEGATDLAEEVMKAAQKPGRLHLSYSDSSPIRKKIESIAKRVYLAKAVVYEKLAEQQIDRYEKRGLGDLPICMAKTHLSLSHDPSLKGVPKGFTVPVREVRLSAGAGFLVPLLGTVRTMPGLPTRPAFMDVDIDEHGEVVGIF
ncbi:MAG: formate--tetrahydrofolate ligase, partial [Planctomycetota bacterium]